MAPLKRTLDAYLFADEALAHLDSAHLDSSAVEIMMVDHMEDPLFSPCTKKLKTATATPAEAISAKTDLAGYLDFGEYQTGSPEAIVPSAKDLVSGTDDWLGSRPGSPSHVSFHELPGEDDWLSSGPSSPSSDLDFEPSSPSSSLFDDSDVFNPVFESGDVMDRAAAGMLATTSDAVRNQSVSPPAAAVPSPVQTVVPAVTTNVTAPITATPKPILAPTTKPAKVTKSKAASKTAGKSKAKTIAAAAVTAVAPPEQKADANRWAHNSTERKRRCEIRRLFSDLRDLFPDLQGDERVSNINTLSRAIQCVAELDREAMEQAMALHTLRERNASLKAATAARNGGVLPAKFASQPAAQAKQYRSVEATKTVISDTYPQKIEAAPLVSCQSPAMRKTTATEKNLMARAAEDPSLRRTLPLALRELMDHNGRGACEVAPLPPRRPKLVRAE